jgi:hypothetical protein
MKLTDPRPMSEPPKLNGVYLVKFTGRDGEPRHALRAYNRKRSWTGGHFVQPSAVCSLQFRPRLYELVRLCLRFKSPPAYEGETWQGLTEDLRP